MGFWQAGNCAFTVSNWSSDVNFTPLPLTKTPIWVVLRNVPPPLFTFDGLSVIGSAMGDSFYTYKPKLVWNSLGMVKVLMELDKQFPASIRVVNKLGNLVMLVRSTCVSHQNVIQEVSSWPVVSKVSTKSLNVSKGTSSVVAKKPALGPPPPSLALHR